VQPPHDRDELPASGDLGTELRNALTNSRFQIVVCSPRSAKSHWVNEEIKHFKRTHGEFRTLALIVGGEPYSGGDTECFPPALRFRLDEAGEVSNVAAEPIAADIRTGKDGKRLALLKLIAGITGLKLDALARRDAARRQRQMAIITAMSLSVAVVTIGLAIYAEVQRRVAEEQRRVAEEQRRLADRSLEFLVTTFKIGNPATENPRTITALNIVDRVSQRAGGVLRSEPAVGARLLQATGEMYMQLGLIKKAEHDIQESLKLQPPKSEGRALGYLRLAELAAKRNDTKESAALTTRAEHSYDRDADYAPLLDARVAAQRGAILYREGKYAASAAQLARSANLYEQVAPALYQQMQTDNCEGLAGVLMSQGASLVPLKRYAEADALFARAQQLWTATAGATHVCTANAINNRAWAASENEQYHQARPTAEQAAAIYQKVLEGDHPTIAASQLLLGRIRAEDGDPNGAIVSLDKARGIFVRLYGPTNAAVGDVDFYAGQAEGKRGHLDAALRRFASTKAIYDVAYGPDDVDQAELLHARADVLRDFGRMADALHNCESAVTLQTRLDSRYPKLADWRKDCAAMRQK
jgi:tetratricopeptide (TPR) repeat protein